MNTTFHSPELQELLESVQAQAVRERHPTICTEHLLLQLIDKNDKVRETLQVLNIDIPKLNKMLRSALEPGVCNHPIDETVLFHSPYVKNVIASAEVLRQQSSDPQTTQAHLFLALLKEGRCIATETLNKMRRIPTIKSTFNHLSSPRRTEEALAITS